MAAFGFGVETSNEIKLEEEIVEQTRRTSSQAKLLLLALKLALHAIFLVSLLPLKRKAS